MKRLDLIGRTFGRLTVSALSPERYRGRSKWNCVCVCGNRCTVEGNHLLRQERPTQSCGCLYRESRKTCFYRHGGKSKIDPWPEYGIWRAMIQRCHRPKTAGYKHYGGRGIRVCDRWRNSFAAFIEDMGRRPSPELTIDRRDNDKGYDKGNCHWATPIEQANNKRNVRRVTISGVTKTLTGWAKDSGLPRYTLISRYERQWSPELFLSPLGTRRKNQSGMLIEHRGRNLGIASWAAELGANEWTLRRWLKAGYDLAEIFKRKAEGSFPMKLGQNRRSESS